MNEPYDSQWLEDIHNITDPKLKTVDELISICFSTTSVVKGYILYNYTIQQALVPNLITLSGLLDAVLLEDHFATMDTPLLYDANVEWVGYTALDASRYVYDNYVNFTSTLAFMNPGYDNAAYPRDPPLTGTLQPGLIDYITKNRIFNFYLNDACVKGTPEYEFMLMMTTNNPWPRPIPVYGYNDAYPIAGDIFEAETGCTEAHNMGQIASTNVNNLAFFSRQETTTTPIPQNPVEKQQFNSSKTYITLVIGDGDNISYLKTSRKSWMQQRMSYCSADPSYPGCFPLVWSISPQAAHLAPDWLEWYYNASYATRHDFFMLPPSGDLYSYPSEMPSDVLEFYVSNTEQDCTVLSTSATVEWEWFGHWKVAVDSYFPRYAENNIVRGIFTVNVPFNLPTPTIFNPDEYYRIVSESVVVFKSREWRGTDSGDTPFSHHNFLTVEQMASELNHLPLGTVSWIYITSDGGGNLDMLYDLVQILDEHVMIVDHETLIDLALQRG